METKNNCPFCDLSIQGRILAESKNAAVFFSNPRKTKCHLLVIPKRHVEAGWELSTEERNEIFDFINKYQKLLAEKIGTGCDLIQNYRPFLPQSRLKVDHVHYHLIPRTLNDELYLKSQIFERDVFKDLPDGEIDEVIDIIGR